MVIIFRVKKLINKIENVITFHFIFRVIPQWNSMNYIINFYFHYIYFYFHVQSKENLFSFYYLFVHDHGCIFYLLFIQYYFHLLILKLNRFLINLFRKFLIFIQAFYYRILSNFNYLEFKSYCFCSYFLKLNYLFFR